MIAVPILLGEDVSVIARRLTAVAVGLVAVNRVERELRDYPPLYESGVRYRQEPRGVDRWLTIPLVLAAGVGDCEDLAGWRTSELPEGRARVLVIPTSTERLFHAIVEYDDGAREDPSKICASEHRTRRKKHGVHRR